MSKDGVCKDAQRGPEPPGKGGSVPPRWNSLPVSEGRSKATPVSFCKAFLSTHSQNPPFQRQLSQQGGQSTSRRGAGRMGTIDGWKPLPSSRVGGLCVQFKVRGEKVSVPRICQACSWQIRWSY